MAAFRLALVVMVSLATMANTRPLPAEVTADQVRQAIQRGVAYLKQQQRPDGTWSDHVGMPGGITALCTLALLNSGVPPDDPSVSRPLEFLRRLKPGMTYPTALQTMVLCAAQPEKDLLLIRRNVRLFEESQVRQGDKRGAWAYSASQGNGDNSNTQFALLALYEASRVGVPVSEQTWRLAHDYFQRTQNVDGSWGYLPGLPGTGSMTCAGISALVMARDALEQGDAQVLDQKVHCCGQQHDDGSLARALDWLGSQFTVHSNPGTRGVQSWLYYYLYGVERVGRLTNRRFIGRHDWYREGAEKLVQAQDGLSGFWKGIGHAEDNPTISTSLVLLFLAKGRRPILVAKLKHGPGDDWNHHRGDLGNLTRSAERRWKRDLTWQVIDSARAAPDDLIEAPVLYLSGQLPLELSDETVDNLRTYLDRGGFLLAEQCCGGDRFDTAFRALMKRMFPEPEYELRLLPPEHPIWSAEEPVNPDYLRPLWGIEFGCRTSVVYCPEDLGCYWELDRLGRKPYTPEVEAEIDAVRAIGLNVLAYATGREVRDKLDIPHIAGDEPDDPLDRARIYIAKLRHGGGWNAAPGALMNLLAAVQRETGLRLSTDRRELEAASEQLFRHHLVFMHGRNTFRFSDTERKQLRAYLERGGILFADAICASQAFDAAFRNELAAILPEHRLEPIPADHPMFTPQFGGFELTTVSRRHPRRRADDGSLDANVRQVPPELYGLRMGDRYTVIYSPYDLSCALERHDSLDCPGYTRDDAARIGLNVVLYTLHH